MLGGRVLAVLSILIVVLVIFIMQRNLFLHTICIYTHMCQYCSSVIWFNGIHVFEKIFVKTSDTAFITLHPKPTTNRIGVVM